MIFRNVRLLNEDFVFETTDVAVEGDRFTSIPTSQSKTIDCTGLWMIPGLVDIHTHGAAGYDAMDPGFEAINGISRHMATHGTTTFLPTIMTDSHDTMREAAAHIGRAREQVEGARIGGIYMEGPYFSMKYKGAQNPAHVRLPSVDEFRSIHQAAEGLIKIVSLAPELPGADAFIESVRSVTRIAAGHTDADYATMRHALDLGLSQLTHTFNAMRPLHHREPGAIAAAMEGGAFCECIADGMHVHPAMVRLLYHTVGRERLILISDSIRPAGLPDGTYTSGGQTVFMTNGKATLEDGTIAGSSSSLLDCVRQAIRFGIPPEDAVRAATYNPAVAAGIADEAGVICPGRRADFLLVDEHLALRAVYIGGTPIDLN